MQIVTNQESEPNPISALSAAELANAKLAEDLSLCVNDMQC